VSIRAVLARRSVEGYKETAMRKLVVHEFGVVGLHYTRAA
jgi:hypothetical protein